MNQADFFEKIPGCASIVAPHYPLKESGKWYEGSDLRTSSHLVGRANMLEEIVKSLEVQDRSAPKLVALTGIGGIG